MGQVENSVLLYTMMADRCEATGFAPHQAKIYRELADLVSHCQTIDEATNKIKNSKLFLAPTEALVRDKITAGKRAAEDLGMPEVATVYEEKLAKIDNDQGEMYTAGYETSAQNIRSEYVLTVQAFAEIYRAYVCYLSDGNESYINEIHKNLGILKKPTSDFNALATMDKFRNLTKASPEGYEKFVRDINTLVAGGRIEKAVETFDAKIGAGLENPDDAWEKVKAHKDEILARGKNVQRFAQIGRAVATAPTVQEYEAARVAGEKVNYKFEGVGSDANYKFENAGVTGSRSNFNFREVR